MAERMEMIDKVEFLGHATFKINGRKTIYFDPYQIDSDDRADLILITHSHFDHCSPEDIEKLIGEDTTVVCSKDCVNQIAELGCNVIGINPYENVNVHGVLVDSVPAYNINKD